MSEVPRPGITGTLVDIAQAVGIPTLMMSVGAFASRRYPELSYLVNAETGLALGTGMLSFIIHPGWIRSLSQSATGAILGHYIGRYLDVAELGTMLGAAVGSTYTWNSAKKAEHGEKHAHPALREERGIAVVVFALSLLGMYDAYVKWQGTGTNTPQQQQQQQPYRRPTTNPNRPGSSYVPQLPSEPQTTYAAAQPLEKIAQSTHI